MATFIPVESAEDLLATRELFREYAAGLGVDLSFQHFDAERAELLGAYAPPTGRLILARVEAEPAGCIALRALEPAICEMKRLYVRPAFRGLGLGRQLVERIIAEAQTAGYAQMRLDTLPTMAEARRLCREVGFKEIPAYCYNPVPGTSFMELMLSTKMRTDAMRASNQKHNFPNG
jgi:GNAT superfamily N-acetyltransferase